MNPAWLPAALYIAAGLAIVLLAGAWSLAYWSTHPFRVPILTQPSRSDGPYEEVSFQSRDGLRLSGWYFSRAEARATVVLCHGHQFNRTQALPVMRALGDEPLNFLLFDFRCAGRSEGKLSTIGADERLDIIGAVDWIERRTGGSVIPTGVFGYSMGGAAAILAAAEDHRIAAVATQGAYATLERAIADRGRFFLGVMGILLTAPARRLGRRWLGHDPSSVAPVAVIGSISPRPVMISHGRRDPFVNPADARLLYEAAGEPRTLRILPKSWHITVGKSDRDAYYRDLRAFFHTALIEPASALRTRPTTARTETL